jgi:tetratricopeptide (TPR) repeat protein
MYYNKDDYDKAIADYIHAIRLDPNSAAAYNNRGIAYYAKGDYDQAIADCEAALRIDPILAQARALIEQARQAAQR